MNFAASIIAWAMETNNTTLRDLGIFLYTNEAQSIYQYWFDKDDDVFPKNT